MKSIVTVLVLAGMFAAPLEAQKRTPVSVKEHAMSAVVFDGTASNDVICGCTSLGGLTEATVEAWFYGTGANGSPGGGIVAQYSNGLGADNFGSFYVRAQDGVIKAQFDYLTNVGAAALSTTELQQNTWYHVAAVLKEGSVRIYLNGMDDTNPNTQTNNGFESIRNTEGTVTTIGSTYGNGVQTFTGYIDEVRLWTYGRSAEEIGSSYMYALHGTEPGLLGYFQFNEGAGSTTALNGVPGSDCDATVKNPELWVSPGFIPFPPVQDDPSWVVQVNVGMGAYYARASFGMNTAASDTLDAGFDTPEPPVALDDQVRAFFYHPEWQGILSDTYIADIRAYNDMPAGPFTWQLTVTTDMAGEGFISLNRPAGFTWPIVVLSDDERWVSDGGDIAIPFTAGPDGMVRTYTILVGDNTPPVISGQYNMNGPLIWDNAIDRNIGWMIEDQSPATSYAEYSINYGETWIPVGKDTPAKRDCKGIAGRATECDGPNFFIPGGLDEYEDLWFRIIAVDAAGNQSMWFSDDPISLVSNVQRRPIEAGWQMTGPSFGSFFAENSVFAPGFRFDWNGFGYDETASYQSGRGTWVGAYEPGMDVMSGQVQEGWSFHFYPNGWSMLSSPLLRPVAADSLTIQVGAYQGEFFTWAQAVDSNWVAPFLMGYHPVDGYYMTDYVLPNTGYWVGVNPELEGFMAIGYPVHRFGGILKTTPPAGRVELTFADGTSRQTLMFGTGEFNMPAPPPAPNAKVIALEGPATSFGSLYISRKTENGKEHRINLKTTGSSRTITVSWNGHNDPGMNHRLVFADGTSFDLRQAGSASWNTAQTAPYVSSAPVATSNGPDATRPAALTLHQNYPNPFNPATTIRFDLPAAAQVSLKVYNLVGQEVAALTSGMKPAGTHTLSFDASNLASGVYVYRLQAGSTVLTRRMVLVK